MGKNGARRLSQRRGSLHLPPKTNPRRACSNIRSSKGGEGRHWRAVSTAQGCDRCSEFASLACLLHWRTRVKANKWWGAQEIRWINMWLCATRHRVGCCLASSWQWHVQFILSHPGLRFPYCKTGNYPITFWGCNWIFSVKHLVNCQAPFGILNPMIKLNLHVFKGFFCCFGLLFLIKNVLILNQGCFFVAVGFFFFAFYPGF